MKIETLPKEDRRLVFESMLEELVKGESLTMIVTDIQCHSELTSGCLLRFDKADKTLHKMIKLPVIKREGRMVMLDSGHGDVIWIDDVVEKAMKRRLKFPMHLYASRQFSTIRNLVPIEEDAPIEGTPIEGTPIEDTPKEDTPTGRKDDKGKLRYSLIPPSATRALAEVLTFGAEKYEANNWKHVEDAESRYLDAVYRHLEAYRQGERLDDESGLPHLAHAMTNIAFLTHFQEEI